MTEVKNMFKSLCTSMLSPTSKPRDAIYRKYIKMGIVFVVLSIAVYMQMLAPVISILAGAWVAHEHKTLMTLGMMMLTCTSTSASVEWEGSKRFNLLIHVMTSIVFMMYSPFIGAITLAYPISSLYSMYKEHKLEKKLREHMKANIPKAMDLDEEPECDQAASDESKKDK
jgi:hypothetical protein